MCPTPPFSRWREPARRAAPACRRVTGGCNGMLGRDERRTEHLLLVLGQVIATTTLRLLEGSVEPKHERLPKTAKYDYRWIEVSVGSAEVLEDPNRKGIPPR